MNSTVSEITGAPPGEAYLDRFLESKGGYRQHLQKPWRAPCGIARTNGHVLVVTPDDGRECDGPNTEALSNVVMGFAAVADDADKREWITLSDFALPPATNCDHCHGAGHKHEMECDECEGGGDFNHGSHTYTCKECDGGGTVKAPRKPEFKVECSRCNGTGEGFQAVKVYTSWFQRPYLSLLAGLPNCRLTLGADPMASTVFTFDGGFGAIMPCRE